MSSRYVTAWLSVLTLTTCRPAGIAPLTLEQLDAGARKIVAPASRAPTIFCWMPPIGSTFPLTSISPVPAVNLPAGRFCFGQFVDEPERDHLPRAGPADAGHAEVHRERELELPGDLDAHHRASAGLLGPDLDGLAPAVAHDGQGQGAARRVRADQRGQVRLAGHRVGGHRLAVHGGDHVPGPEPPRRGEARLGLDHDLL